MKKCFALLLAGVLCAGMLAACGGSGSSSSAPAVANSPAPATSDVAASTADSATDAPDAGQYDLAKILADLSAAANLGTAIPMTDLDLRAGGVDMDIVVEWAGETSQRAAENGGQVIVLRAVAGQADALAQQMEELRDSHINDNYAENATANANTADARIVTNGDYVVYAVSATGSEGGYPALDDAITAAFS